MTLIGFNVRDGAGCGRCHACHGIHCMIPHPGHDCRALFAYKVPHVFVDHGDECDCEQCQGRKR